jgi:DNA-damage-inducible protein D
MVKIGSGAERKQEDIMLTRYACYLIAQNGDPKKEQIAFAQSYCCCWVPAFRQPP